MSDFSVTYSEYQNRVANSIKNHKRIVTQLQSLLIQRKDIQKDIYNDIVNHCLDTFRVVEDVVNNNVNIDSIKNHNMMLEQEGYTDDGEEKE